LSIIFPPENMRIFDHVLFTFNRKRMGLDSAAFEILHHAAISQLPRPSLGPGKVGLVA
jgi:hypothetical protein